MIVQQFQAYSRYQLRRISSLKPLVRG